jgi:hypothetical protein
MSYTTISIVYGIFNSYGTENKLFYYYFLFIVQFYLVSWMPEPHGGLV